MADMGVDGVFVTPAEEPVCYQSKFRTGRPALTWTELSTFYGLADVGGRRLVFTNCDEVARVAEERLGAIFVRGSDLDRLTPEDFQILEAWLAGATSHPEEEESEAAPSRRSERHCWRSVTRATSHGADGLR